MMSAGRAIHLLVLFLVSLLSSPSWAQVDLPDTRGKKSVWIMIYNGWTSARYRGQALCHEVKRIFEQYDLMDAKVHIVEFGQLYDSEDTAHVLTPLDRILSNPSRWDPETECPNKLTRPREGRRNPYLAPGLYQWWLIHSIAKNRENFIQKMDDLWLMTISTQRSRPYLLQFQTDVLRPPRSSRRRRAVREFHEEVEMLQKDLGLDFEEMVLRGTTEGKRSLIRRRQEKWDWTSDLRDSSYEHGPLIQLSHLVPKPRPQVAARPTPWFALEFNDWVTLVDEIKVSNKGRFRVDGYTAPRCREQGCTWEAIREGETSWYRDGDEFGLRSRTYVGTDSEPRHLDLRLSFSFEESLQKEQWPGLESWTPILQIPIRFESRHHPYIFYPLLTLELNKHMMLLPSLLGLTQLRTVRIFYIALILLIGFVISSLFLKFFILPRRTLPQDLLMKIRD